MNENDLGLIGKARHVPIKVNAEMDARPRDHADKSPSPAKRPEVLQAFQLGRSNPLTFLLLDVLLNRKDMAPRNAFADALVESNYPEGDKLGNAMHVMIRNPEMTVTVEMNMFTDKVWAYLGTPNTTIMQDRDGLAEQMLLIARAFFCLPTGLLPTVDVVFRNGWPEKVTFYNSLVLQQIYELSYLPITKVVLNDKTPIVVSDPMAAESGSSPIRPFWVWCRSYMHDRLRLLVSGLNLNCCITDRIFFKLGKYDIEDAAGVKYYKDDGVALDALSEAIVACGVQDCEILKKEINLTNATIGQLPTAVS